MNEKVSGRLSNIKQIRALNDPYRQEILSHLVLLGKPSTAKEIAVSMKEAPSKVNYHIKVLEKYNFVEIDHTESINGIIAKYYKMTSRKYEFAEDGEITDEKQTEFINMLAGMYDNSKAAYVKRAIRALEEKESGRHVLQISRGKMYLSEEEIDEIDALFKKLSQNDKEGRKLYDMFSSYARVD